MSETEAKTSPQQLDKATVDQVSASEFYTKRQKIYPREVHGVFATLRVLGISVLLGIFYGVPWLRWDDRQAVLLDLPERQFHIFGWTFWPQDFFYLAILLIIAALALFFFTALAGRLWCGFACPQTVWTEVFLWIERKIEGGRSQQIKLDKSTGLRKYFLKSRKHFVWIVFSLFTGFTFVGYFTPLEVLYSELVNFEMGPWETFWVLFYAMATYGNAGWMREQVCTYMCPYARFQSAMFDKNTLVISYDKQRGDPRAGRKRNVDHHAQGLGDCVDCTLCVQVCPTGIDIRDGLQYQCIGCAACVDVCDSVMARMNYAPGLIRYTTENALAGKTTKLLRPRVLVYGSLLVLLLILLSVLIAVRVPLELDVIRDRNALYRETNEGLIENAYILKVINMDTQSHHYALELTGLDNARLILKNQDISVAPGKVLNVPVQIQVDPVELTQRSQDITFTVSARGRPDLQQHETARFLGPLVR